MKKTLFYFIFLVSWGLLLFFLSCTCTHPNSCSGGGDDSIIIVPPETEAFCGVQDSFATPVEEYFENVLNEPFQGLSNKEVVFLNTAGTLEYWLVLKSGEITHKVLKLGENYTFEYRETKFFTKEGKEIESFDFTADKLEMKTNQIFYTFSSSQLISDFDLVKLFIGNDLSGISDISHPRLGAYFDKKISSEKVFLCIESLSETPQTSLFSENNIKKVKIINNETSSVRFALVLNVANFTLLKVDLDPFQTLPLLWSDGKLYTEEGREVFSILTYYNPPEIYPSILPKTKVIDGRKIHFLVYQNLSQQDFTLVDFFSGTTFFKNNIILDTNAGGSDGSRLKGFFSPSSQDEVFIYVEEYGV